METPITCLVLVQGLKTLMNWSTVILQRPHITRGFMGTFHISLNVVDTVLTLVLLVTHALQDVRLCGMRWTSHHVCLLLQISSFVYNALHWPVLVVSGLDHYWLAPLGSASVHWTRRLGYVLIAAALWTSAALHVFLSPGYRPHLQDTSHRLLSSCQAPGSPQVPQVSSSVLLATVAAALYAEAAGRRPRPSPVPRPRGLRQDLGAVSGPGLGAGDLARGGPGVPGHERALAVLRQQLPRQRDAARGDGPAGRHGRPL
ncbi:putative G-protein coupled receptor 160 isoform X2 [Denticeps clupeoides]|nr:probable G-protein coupled receptor 160 isoform X2 [Denticeps clupeoides]XP_028834310.1 probable G-protein coupled receptor 160 isoform X2 [Denticeps clupeoides]XP_028834312.1 probable G-protein coupled receptor 160 isoform X2 [Denticeps clupeoides]